MHIVEERHSTIAVEEVYHNPPHHHHGVPQVFVVNDEPSAPPAPAAPPAPPPMTVVNTNVYLNSQEYVTGYAVAPPPPPLFLIPPPPSLPFCGMGVGWFLFIVGWFLCGIPWYVGAIILVCSKVDPRERPGYIACTIIAIVITILAIIMAAKGK